MRSRKLSIAQVHLDIIAHSYRLMIPVGATACALGLSPDEVYRIGLAALLHDVGKFAISTAILLKPGPLTMEELAVMHRHPEIGLQILSRIGGDPADVGSIVVAHHEHWDGRGYPTGLAKGAIPLEARILSVADAYDAMTSTRVYRQTISPQEARVELQRCSGHQFDPQVVAAFLQVLDGRSALGHIHMPLQRKQRKDARPVNLFAIRNLVAIVTGQYASVRQP